MTPPIPFPWLRTLGLHLVVFLIFASAPLPSPARTPVVYLNLHQALPVVGPANVQPSGLTLCRGLLLTVSDRHDDTVFNVRMGTDAAYLDPYLRFTAPSRRWMERLDFEGITCDSEGNLFLVSETRDRILQLSPDGSRAEWIGPKLTRPAREKGLLRTDNAHFEGISRIAPGRFVLSAEREPRGFVEVDLGSHPAQVHAYPADASIFAFAGHRSPDFSGLYLDRGTLYVLERNAFVVVKLLRRENRWIESSGWSYRHIIERPALRYTDMRFGKAEGLCMDDRYVYLILDNNGIARARHPHDKRPLLLILHRPPGL